MKTIMIASLVLTLAFGSSVFGQDLGRGSLKVKTADEQTPGTLYTGSFALVIGVSEYTNGWDNLPGVVSDVEAVKTELIRHKFHVKTVVNPTERELDREVHDFIKKYGQEFGNRLIFYFAGHGYTEQLQDQRNIGYIVPADAASPKSDLAGFRRKAIPMDTILSYARRIQSKHALFIFDSCFSGKLVSRGGFPAVPLRIKNEVKQPVRQFITAGSADQVVPDESIFRPFFIRGIAGAADRNGDGYVLGTELADYLKEKVIEYSESKQTPQYGKIRDVNLDLGDFVFVVPPDCSCPTVEVTGPPSITLPGENMTFQAKVTGMTDNTNYEWSIDKGEIVNGQGTSIIVIKTDGLEGVNVEAKVRLRGGICPGCDVSATDTGVVAAEIKPILLDEFGRIVEEDLNARIYNLNLLLASNPTDTLYIVNYSPENEVTKREKMIKDFIKFRLFPTDRIVFVNGGRETDIRTRIWQVPPGADPSFINY